MLQRRITNITYTCTLVHPTQSLLWPSRVIACKTSRTTNIVDIIKKQIHHRVICDFSVTELHIMNTTTTLSR